MLPFSVRLLSSTAVQDEYRCQLERELQEKPYSGAVSSKENWAVVKSCIVSTAERMVGREKRKQPEESADELMPLIEVKNEAHTRMLADNSVAARKAVRQWQQMVKRAVDRVREKWIVRVARENEAAVRDGKTRWESIQKLQQAYMLVVG